MVEQGRVVEKARRGDEAAWRTLYDRHVDLLFRLALAALLAAPAGAGPGGAGPDGARPRGGAGPPP